MEEAREITFSFLKQKKKQTKKDPKKLKSARSWQEDGLGGTLSNPE